MRAPDPSRELSLPGEGGTFYNEKYGNREYEIAIDDPMLAVLFRLLYTINGIRSVQQSCGGEGYGK